MGQKSSRSMASRLESGLQKARAHMDKQMLEEAEAKAASGKFSDPHATIDGFQRGQGPDRNPRDLAQEQYLKQKLREVGGTVGNTEMSEDLINFLKDVGPLERKIDKELSSPRWLAAQQDKELANVKREVTSKRKVREMPILEGTQEFLAFRSTNFSSSTDADEEKDFGLGDLELHELILLKPSSGLPSSVAAKLQEQDRVQEANARIESCREYLGLPVVLKDGKDDSFTGAWEHQLSEMKFLGLEVMPEDRVKIVMNQVLELQQSRVTAAPDTTVTTTTTSSSSNTAK